MAKSVKAQVIRQGAFEYNDPVIRHVFCDNISLQGTYWRTPVVDGIGTLIRFDYLDGDKPKPTEDSVKVIRIQNNDENTHYFILVADDATEDVFATACAACCGEENPMPFVVMPEPILEDVVCKDASGNYNHFTIADALGAGEVYLAFGSINGAMLAAAPNEGFASLADFRTWAAANWSTAGTWGVTGNKVTLVSTTAKAAMVRVVKAKLFESANAPTLSGGQVFRLSVTVDGKTATVDGGTTTAALATAANASMSVQAISKGKFASVSGPKIRLTSQTATTATLTITAVAGS